MSRRLALIMPVLALSAASCGQAKEDCRIVNGDFEQGDLTGFSSIEGTAFSDAAITVAGSDAMRINASGDFYLDSSHSESDLSATGKMDSTRFKIGPNTRLTMSLGAMKNPDLCHIDLVDAETGETLLSITNRLFNQNSPSRRMRVQSTELGQFAGRECFLRFVDDDDGSDGYNYILADDIRFDYLGEDDDGTLVGDANSYIAKAAPELPDSPYRHAYHLMPEIGWMNDLNGFIYYDGAYHMFYQHNPYSPAWDLMHWGHAVSTDLLHWETLPVALAPDMPYDLSGCYSGGAFVGEDGSLNLLYTAVGEGGVQQQAMATSYDGVNFSKRQANPVIDSSMRGESRITDFRDPYCFLHDGDVYAVIGGKNEGPGGSVYLYKQTGEASFAYVGKSYSTTVTGDGMLECPNYVSLGGKDVIITSPQSVRSDELGEFQNLHSVAYLVGEMDFSTGEFVPDVDSLQELDKGFDFYATQILDLGDRQILMAWMNMWSRNYPSAVYGTAGEATLPREITLVDGHIYQKPIQEVDTLFGDPISVPDASSSAFIGNGAAARVKCKINVSSLGSGKAGLNLFEGSGEAVKVYYDGSLGALVFDRSNSGLEIKSDAGVEDDGLRYAVVSPDENGDIELDCFLDKSSVEVFINGGYLTMSGLAYPSEGSDGISFFADGGEATLHDANLYLLEEGK